MRVLLVNPAKRFKGFLGTTRSLQPTVLPNSLLFIGAVLEKGGHQVQIWDQQVDARQPADFFKSFNPDLIGFSVSVGGIIQEAIEQSKEFKRLNPSINIAWGNVHPSMLPEQTLDEDYVDFVVIGPGEYTMLELADHVGKGKPKSLGEINGLAFKQDDKVIVNPDRPFIKNLDELPDPAWHLVPMEDYWEKSLNTSRGCPSQCIFCYNPPFHKGQLGDKVELGQYLIFNEELERFLDVFEFRRLTDEFQQPRRSAFHPEPHRSAAAFFHKAHVFFGQAGAGVAVPADLHLLFDHQLAESMQPRPVVAEIVLKKTEQCYAVALLECFHLGYDALGRKLAKLAFVEGRIVAEDALGWTAA